MSFIKKNLFPCFFEMSAFGVELMTVSLERLTESAKEKTTDNRKKQKFEEDDNNIEGVVSSSSDKESKCEEEDQFYSNQNTKRYTRNSKDFVFHLEKSLAHPASAEISKNTIKV